MGGGGGDGGYEAKQAQIEAKKQAARDSLNQLFGVPGNAAAPDRAKFVKQAVPSTHLWTADSGDGPDISGSPETFDEAGYNTELGKYQDAQKNAGARNQLYQTVRDNAFTAGKRKLDEDKTKAERNLRFELFAKGLAGGSEDVNQNALLGRTYDNGVLDLGAKADAAKAQFRGDDENARLGMLQSIDAGTDQGSAISSAMNQMAVNSDRAAAAAQGTTLGDLFSNAGLLYSKSQAAQGKQVGQDWWNTYTAGRSNATRGSNGSVTGVGG